MYLICMHVPIYQSNCRCMSLSGAAIYSTNVKCMCGVVFCKKYIYMPISHIHYVN